MLRVGIMMLESVMYRNEHLLVLAMHGICIIILASTVLNLSRYDRNTSTTRSYARSRVGEEVGYERNEDKLAQFE